MKVKSKVETVEVMAVKSKTEKGKGVKSKVETVEHMDKK